MRYSDQTTLATQIKLEGDLKSVGATLMAGIGTQAMLMQAMLMSKLPIIIPFPFHGFPLSGVITWWRGVWALLDHYIGDSVFGHVLCVVLGLMIILYVRFAGLKLANFFPNL